MSPVAASSQALCVMPVVRSAEPSTPWARRRYNIILGEPASRVGAGSGGAVAGARRFSSVILRIRALPLLVDRCLSAAYHVGVEDLQREERRRDYPVRTTRVEHVHGDNRDDRQHARPPAEAKKGGEAHEERPGKLSRRDQGASRERGGPVHEPLSATSQTPLRRRLPRLAGDGGLRSTATQHVGRQTIRAYPWRFGLSPASRRTISPGFRRASYPTCS